ncbi:MAG: nucleotidyl transferase AbiEii/AbiGii toxin family protein [Acidobacteriota bacterium]
MIDRREVIANAATLGLRPDVVEKDYVLAWLLAGIFGHAALRDKWVFKGGTCLKKCYFETYRFSEGLDFTLTDASHFRRWSGGCRCLTVRRGFDRLACLSVHRLRGANGGRARG